jgi:hypothetical protein
MKKLVLLLFVSNIAHAGPYIELGIAKADGGTCIGDMKNEYTPPRPGCSLSPLGNATIGYNYKGFSAEVEHWSSLQEKDRGLNLFTIKYRYEFRKR